MSAWSAPRFTGRLHNRSNRRDYWRMPVLTRRRSPDAPEECCYVYYGDVRVGTIALRTGMPPGEDPWGWSCGFYPGSHPREYTDGTAANFARIGVMRALNRGHVREFNPSRKDPHLGRKCRLALFAVGRGDAARPRSASVDRDCRGRCRRHRRRLYRLVDRAAFARGRRGRRHRRSHGAGLGRIRPQQWTGDPDIVAA